MERAKEISDGVGVNRQRSHLDDARAERVVAIVMLQLKRQPQGHQSLWSDGNNEGKGEISGIFMEMEISVGSVSTCFR